MRNSEGRIESLDGLRAVSITLVIFSHLIGVKGFIVPERVGRVFELGELGVRVFFVISGFLITSILLKELEDHRTSISEDFISEERCGYFHRITYLYCRL
jgi:peptidoglycan/LPS O-acetylase OafA/YrhL